MSRIQLEKYLEQEWLVTAGNGGYSSSTVSGANIRRYHGLLVSPIEPPARRWVILSKLEEEIKFNNTSEHISTNVYLGAIFPSGYQYLKSFSPNPIPRWVYDINGIIIIKEIISYASNGNTGVIIKYSLGESSKVAVNVELSLLPLFANRPFHHLTRYSDRFKTNARLDGTRAILVPFGDSSCQQQCQVRTSAGNFVSYSDWYYKFCYGIEKERGQRYIEDLFSPGKFYITLNERNPEVFFQAIAGTEFSEDSQPESRLFELRKAELSNYDLSSLSGKLERSAADFLVKINPQGDYGIIAGYHWFEEWGRDLMISLPGLLICRNRYSEVENILRRFVRHRSKGLLPNRINDSSGEVEYNSVDVSLWLFYVLDYYYKKTDRLDFIQEMYPVLQEIISSYQSGTEFEIKMDADGLINQGNDTTQLTWMDARIDNQPVTPRSGKTIEINGLWYNALAVMAEFSKLLGKDAKPYTKLKTKVANSIVEKFVVKSKDCLADFISAEKVNCQMRPNLLIPLFLPHNPLPANISEQVIKKVAARLFTPLGIRTLAPEDPQYQGRYEGDMPERDRAYHQGTAWPYLLGFYITAYLNVKGRTPENLDKCREMLRPMFRELDKNPVAGHLAEIYDGSIPQRPSGCVAQAWSLAEIMRLYFEEFDQQIFAEGEEIPSDPVTGTTPAF